MAQKAFKYRFYRTPEQETLLGRILGSTRLVYNRALAARAEARYERQERVGYIIPRFTSRFSLTTDDSRLNEFISVFSHSCC
jgi:transposase